MHTVGKYGEIKRDRGCPAGIPGKGVRCGSRDFANDNTKYCKEHEGRDRGDDAMEVAQVTKSKELMVPAAENTSIYQKVEDMLDRVLSFEDEARQAYEGLDSEEWRYNDINGGEQLRSEVAVYERALDRSSRVLKEVTKLGLESQLVRIRQQELQLVKVALGETLQALGLSKSDVNLARRTLAKKLRESYVEVQGSGIDPQSE